MPRCPADSARDARARLARVQERLVEERFDAAVLASEANFTYVTGYTTPSWAMTARPLTVVVEPDRCTAVVGSLDAEPLAAACPWLEIVPYTDPSIRRLDGLCLADFAASAVELIAGVLDGRGVRRLGIEASAPSASGLPHASLLALAAALGVELHDVAPVLWRLRQIKTPYELDRLAHVGQQLGRLYELFAERARPGMSERELHGLVRSAAGEVDVDRIGYSIAIAGDSIGEGFPGERRWERGELLLLDTSLVADGYASDFCRHYAAGDADDAQVEGYARLVRAVQAGRTACRPGATMGDLVAAMVEHLPAQDGASPLDIGRIGHGIGLDLTEPPSVAPADDTTLQPGMALTVEPSGTYPCGHLEAEEMVAITDDGHRLLSPPYPAELPVLG
ncbi:MAG TPA: Xaa-Pro peptidase family protein [Conexibacter sp.]|nr:Xaa-Pro peptidase family protein [Conexibacter sp.]